MAFDGTGDYLSLASSADFKMGSSDFTIEFFLSPSVISSSAGLVASCGDFGNNTGWGIFVDSGLVYYRFHDGSGKGSSYPVEVGMWHHWAVTKSGSTKVAK